VLRIILPISDEVKGKLEELAVQNLDMDLYINEISEILAEVDGNPSKEEIQEALSNRYEELKELGVQEETEGKKTTSSQENYEILDGLLISAATIESCDFVLNALNHAQRRLFNTLRLSIENEAVNYFAITPQDKLSAKSFIELIAKKILIKNQQQKEFLEKKIHDAFEACKEAFSSGNPNDTFANKLYRASSKAFTTALKAISVAASAGLFAANIISMISVPADFGVTFAVVGIIAKVISSIKSANSKMVNSGIVATDDMSTTTAKTRAHHDLAKNMGEISKALLALTPQERAKAKLSALIALEKVNPHGKQHQGKAVKPSATPEKDLPEGSGAGKSI